MFNMLHFSALVVTYLLYLAIYVCTISITLIEASTLCNHGYNTVKPPTDTTGTLPNCPYYRGILCL